MNEKEMKERAEEIVEALTCLSLGKEPGLLSGKVYKRLAAHANFSAIRDAYAGYLQSFDGKTDTTEELKKLFDFRIQIVQLFDQEIENDVQ